MLEHCLRAERQIPGSSTAIVERAQGQARADLEHMLLLGLALDLSSPRLIADASITDDRKHALRARIMRRIENDSPPHRE
jgi:hypothetical protein